jgi:beta-N-acetylhexosaminidase
LVRFLFQTIPKNMKKVFIFLLILFTNTFAQAQDYPFKKYNQAWVDSVFKSLTLDEKIGQLLMPRGNKGNTPYDTAMLYRWVRDYKIGGLVLFANQPTRKALMLNDLQQKSRVPLMIGMDLEWGLTMRLDSTARFPFAMTLGAMQGSNELLYQMGQEVAQQCKRIGVHINYAPVADINNNPNNPVIGFRSFGENRELVFQKAFAYMKGMQDGGIITSIKHFPGHGDTGVDSHADLPIIPHSRQRLDDVELYPFRELINRGATGVMVAHLSIPALDTTKNQASTLSKNIVSDLLRKDLGFKGLVFSDAMDMQGVAKYYPAGIANVKALMAGNDVIETFNDVENTVTAIKKAILEDSLITMAELDDKVKRILAAKAFVGLDKYQPIRLQNLIEDLNPSSSTWLYRQMIENSLTLLKNDGNKIPVKEFANKRIASLSIGKPAFGNIAPSSFQQMLSNYTNTENYNLLPTSPDSLVWQTRQLLKDYDVVLVGIHGMGNRPTTKLDPALLKLINTFTDMDNAIYTLFGNPYNLNKFEGIEKIKSLLLTYQETIETQELAAQLLMGAIGAKGKLPVTVNDTFKYGDGIFSEPIGRFKYSIAEEENLNSKRLSQRLDSLVNIGLVAKAYPGCQLLVARHGKVIYQKAFGKQTYDSTATAVKLSDVYDLASITKVSTSAPALMKLQDEGLFSLDMTLKELMPSWKKSNKADLLMRDILTHQARLRAWIPFWKEIAQNPDGRWKPETFQDHYSDQYPIQIAENLFLYKKFDRQLFDAIRDSPLNEKEGYVYSDLSYYLYPQIVKRITDKSFDKYLQDTFYKSLGANSLTFNAAKYMPLEQIVPTEYDSLFRKELIHGRVHDEGATLLGGISGHAGLFGNANDLAKLFQMYLNGGYYGGKRYLQEATLKEWTSYGYPVSVNARRGIAFDKPDRKKAGISAAPSASERSFGHSGFTGTFVWADPRNGLLYVFLSNRVNPTRKNSKLSDLNIRTQIGEILYEEVKKAGGY